MHETWKAIPDFPLYEASSTGRIRRATNGTRTHAGKIIKPKVEGKGYLRTCLYNGDGTRSFARVNRLVCLAFNGPPPFPGAQAAHEDGDKANNVPNNLTWKTGKQNQGDKVRHGTVASGARNGQAKLTDSDVLSIRATKDMSQRELARAYGVSQYIISRIITRKAWRHL